MAPGPVLGNYFPNGGYAALHDWTAKNPGLAKRFRTAINQSLVYAQTHPDEIRALLPAATRNVRLAVWSPLIDRKQLLQLAKYAKQYDVISTLPNFTQLFPSDVRSGTATGLLEGTVGPTARIVMRSAGTNAVRLDPGKYVVVVKDLSKKLNFHLVGPGVNKKTGTGQTGTVRWSVSLRGGKYSYSSDTGGLRGSFRVS